MITVIHGDMLVELPKLAPDSIDACVCDPPYHLTSIVARYGNTSIDGTGTNERRAKARSDGYGRLSGGFMGKQWDGGDVAFRVETWAEVMRVLKPGGYLLAFGGTRTFHRMACAIEDAGFEIRDTLCWLYGSGFPKSLDVSKAIDKAAGNERELIAERYTVKRIKPGATVEREGAWGKQEIPYTATDTAPGSPEAAAWAGWGTALKPAYEPIIMARKPLGERTVAANVLRHGTGAINVDACRVETGDRVQMAAGSPGFGTSRDDGYEIGLGRTYGIQGRWPANVVTDGSAEVLAGFPITSSAIGNPATQTKDEANIRFNGRAFSIPGQNQHGDSGSAARFFYTSKADAADRLQSKHPTVKPVDLMRWLVRMVTPPGGTVLDPFAGSGTTGMAAMAEGFNAVLIEREAEYVADINRRLAHVEGADTPLFALPCT